MSEANSRAHPDIVDHLKMIQGVIERMARHSFWLRGISAALAAAWLAFVARVGVAEASAGYWPILPLLMLFLLDGYYLSQERRFRKLYDAVRCREATEQFSMNTKRWEQGPFDIFGIIKACLFPPFTTIAFHLPLILLILWVINGAGG